jgi:hypothetical protein
MEEKSFMAKSNALALAGALGDGETSDSQPVQVVESSESKALSNTSIIAYGLGQRPSKIQ